LLHGTAGRLTVTGKVVGAKVVGLTVAGERDGAEVGDFVVDS
jgi:hypothetical protein